MSRPQRIVLDNNLVISRILSTRGVAATVFDLLYDSCTILTSEPVLAELRDVIEREKFDRYLDAAARREFVERYAAAAKLVRISHVVRECRDANDNKLLELVLSGQADVLVTGDSDLLCLHPWRGVAILSPADYLARFS
jgi:putative PIN family toxin of toxin-antitoxin system